MENLTCIWSIEYYYMTEQGEMIDFDLVKASSKKEAENAAYSRAIRPITEIIQAYPTNPAIADITNY